MKPLSTTVAGLGRRAFLRSVAASLAALPLASLATMTSIAGCSDDMPRPPPFDPAVVAILEAYFGADGLEDARLIGDRYLQSLGSDEAAEAAIRPTLDLLDAQTDDAQAVAALKEAVSAEFAHAFYDLDGWILSPTELNLCALVRGAQA